MRKTSVIFFMPSLKAGGGNRACVELANHISVRHNVEIVYPGEKQESAYGIWPQVTVRAIGGFSGGFFGRLSNLIIANIYLALFRRRSIIVVSDPVLAIFSVLYKWRRTFRYLQADDYRLFDDLYLLRNSALLRIYKWLTVLSFKYPINFLFNSSITWQRFSQTSRRQVECRIVTYGIDHTVFYNKRERSQAMINICTVARPHPAKGLSDFVAVMRILGKEARSRVGKVLIISQDDLSSFDLTGFKQIKPKENNKVVNDIYNEANIFVSTSWREGFGLPPLEAMASGCAVLLTDSGGPTAAYAKHNVNCLVVKPRDIESLRTKLELLILDVDIRARLSSAAMQTAAGFVWDKAADQLHAAIFESNRH